MQLLSINELVEPTLRMSRDPLPATRQFLHPIDPTAPPKMPLWSQIFRLQTLAIHGAKKHVEHIRIPFQHGENRIGEVSPTITAERPRTLRRANVTAQRRAFALRGILAESGHARVEKVAGALGAFASRCVGGSRLEADE